ncbi:MAG: MraY family glycosyltransferase [Prevotella sp.]
MMCNFIGITNLLLVFFLCILFTGIIIPQIQLIAFRKRLFDLPDKRKSHQGLVPRLGGTAFMPAVALSFAIMVVTNIMMEQHELIDAISVEAVTLAYVACAVSLSYVVGIADDVRGVRYKTKFLIQTCCSLMLVMGGALLNDLHGLLLIHSLPLWLSLPLSVVGIVFIINAINLIDGIDGLAAGLCFFAFMCYGISFMSCGRILYAMMSLALAGVLIPFFFFNVFGNARRGRKIFMGDTGSLTLGIMLSFLCYQLVAVPVIAPLHVDTLVLAFSPILVPCFDVVRVFLSRICHGVNPFLPDKNHIHHKLMAMGMSQRRAMAIIISATVMLTLLNVVVSRLADLTCMLCADIAIWIVANKIISSKIKTTK